MQSYVHIFNIELSRWKDNTHYSFKLSNLEYQNSIEAVAEQKSLTKNAYTMHDFGPYAFQLIPNNYYI